MSYLRSDGDEVEDLFRLVRFVMRRVPNIQALCSGAIASDYQVRRASGDSWQVGRWDGMRWDAMGYFHFSRCISIYRNSRLQRLRVEHVCSRVGIVSLAYLWRRPQIVLLRDIIASGIDARIAKVAAIGLTVKKHLGKSLADVERDLYKLRAGAARRCQKA